MKSAKMLLLNRTGVSVLLLGLSMVESHPTSAESIFTHGKKIQQASAVTLPSELPQPTPEIEADLLVARGRYADAVAAYKRIKPQTAQILNKTGVAYEHMSMDENAKDSFQRAIKTNRKLSEAYNNLGTVYYHEKDYDNAEHSYKKSIKLNANNAAVYSNLGTLYMARKRFRDGAEAFQRAFILDANIFQEVAEKGLREDGSKEDLANMDYCFAKIYAQAGMNSIAIEYLRKAIIAGFHNMTGLQQDQEFASLRETLEFRQLMSMEHR